MDNTVYWNLVTDSIANVPKHDCVQSGDYSTTPLLVQVVDKKRRIDHKGFRRVISIEKTDFQLSSINGESEASKNRVMMVK